ncbi:MAG TPA: malectin domain-containing carbohydrate-binding protein [Planctomycetaceae bacterium]|nr:malectin domain-containing carbohydrate-binding protein [Planctomycetaceae bacterium]
MLSAATMLAIGVNQPTSGTAGTALTPALTVDIEDSTGHIVTTNSSSVTIKVASGPAGFASGSTTKVAALHGIATLSNLVFDRAGSYSLVASDGTLTKATTGTITVSAATAAKLAFKHVPATGTAGKVLGSVKVAVEDRFGNIVTTNTSTVTLTVASGPGSFAPGSATSVAAVNGVATFANLALDSAGSYTLSAADGSLSGATSGTLAINSAAAAKLAFQQVPASGTTGQALSPSVEVAVEDQFGNVATGNSSTVTLAVASGPGGFASGSTTIAKAVSGVATFSNLLLDTVGPYTLGASDGGLSPATSATITLYTTISWINPSGGNWSNPLNWNGGQVPGPYDDVLINVPGNPTINYDQGTTSIHSLVSDDPLSIIGGSLSVDTTVQVNSTFTLAGGTLANARILPGTSGQGLILTLSGGTLDDVTVDANLDATAAAASITDGLTLNGTAFLGDAVGATRGELNFTNTETLSGTGTVVFGKSLAVNVLDVTNAATLTIGPGITIRGSSGTIEGTSGSTVINDATISADDSGGPTGSFIYDTDFAGGSAASPTSAAIDTSAVTNPAPQVVYQTERYGSTFSYTLPNLTPGASYTVRLDFAELDAFATGQKVMNVSINGIQVLTNFDIFATAGAKDKAVVETFAATAIGSGQIVIAFNTAAFSTFQVASVNGIELFSGTTRVLAINAGLLAGGSFTIEPTSFINHGTVQAISNETLSVFSLTNSDGATISGSGAPVSLGGPWTNAAGASIAVTGGTLDLGDAFVSNNSTWSNAGTISAANATVNLGGSFTSAGLGAFNRTAGTVNLVGALSNTGATLSLGSWNLLGGTITGGTLNETGGAELVVVPTGPSAQIGTLDGVTIDGNLDLSQFRDDYVDVRDGLTLNGTAFVGDASGATYGGLYFTNTETLSGTGTVVFGKSSSSNFLSDARGFVTLTIGPGITVRGSSGRIEAPYGGDKVINQGTISADDSGGAAGSFIYDTDFSGGLTGLTSAPIDTSSVTNPAPQTVYQTERSGNFTYTLPSLTPAGKYTVRLDFAEFDASAAGQKIINVSINGTQVLTSFDIFATAGGNYKAEAETFTATADSNGQIVISISAATGSTYAASVNGIELFSGNTSVLAIDAGLLAGGGFSVTATTNQGTLEASNRETLSVFGLSGNVGVATLTGPGASLSLSGSYTIDQGLTATTGQTLSLLGVWTNSVGSTISATGATLNIGDQFSNSTHAWSNAGTISVANGTANLGGVFTLASLGTFSPTGAVVNLVGTLTNTGTTLALSPTTESWNLQGGNITGGTVTESGGAELVMTSSGGTLDGVTVNGNLDLTEANNANANVVDGLTLNGTAFLGAASGATYGQLLFTARDFTSTEALSGTGTIVFGTYGANNALSVGGDLLSLTIGPSITIRGSSGTINSLFNRSVINQGTISADGSGGAAGGTITINPTTFTNQGTLRATNGEVLNLSNLSPNAGVIHIGIGSVINVTGNFTNVSSGSVVIDIGGTSTSQYGRLQVTGTATLAGTLQVDLVNGFSPAAGNSFQVMTFSSEVGTFSSVLGWPYNVAYDPSDLTLSR